MRDVMLDMPISASTLDTTRLGHQHQSETSVPLYAPSTRNATPTSTTANALSSNLSYNSAASNHVRYPTPLSVLNVIFRRTLQMRKARLLRACVALLAISLIVFVFWQPFANYKTNSTRVSAHIGNQIYLNFNRDNDNHRAAEQLNGAALDPIPPSKYATDSDNAQRGRASNNHNEHSQTISRKLSNVDNDIISDRNDPVFQPVTQSKNFNIKYRSQSNRHSVHTLNNFTHALRVNDFYSMKGINVMQARIREATKFSWDSYERYAWGRDMLRPRSRLSEEWFELGLTIVDSVDTLLMMGLVNEGNKALDWIENEMNLDSKNENSNCFELTIRVLAGLLSAYHLTSREKIKHRAIDLGSRLLHCYDTNVKVIPYSDINLDSRISHPPPWTQHSSLSEIASLQLEFRYLSQISGDPKFESITFQTSEHIHNLTLKRQFKLLPMYIDTKTGDFEDTLITLGARTDSYYEYLLKQYLQTGIKWLEDDYLDAIDEIKKRLIVSTNGQKNYTYVSEVQMYKTINGTDDPRHIHKMDHLVCFFPGTLALGYYHFSPDAHENRLKFNLETPNEHLNPRYNSHIELAQLLSRTCYHMYSDMGTGLAPEIANFVPNHTPFEDTEYSSQSSDDQPELVVKSNSAHNILRPEFVETLFYMYHITGLPMYRQQAREVFDAFHKYARVASGFSPISDVRREPLVGEDINEMLYQRAPDRMESFWISETLKYLYLTFCDDNRIVAALLNYYVFNTEAHILPILRDGLK